MKDKLLEDLKKYEAEIAAINARLADFDTKRNELITHGRRLEGAIAYIRAALAALAGPDDKPTEAESAEPAGAVPAQ